MMERTTMSVQDLSAQMSISLPKAYELVKKPCRNDAAREPLNNSARAGGVGFVILESVGA